MVVMVVRLKWVVVTKTVTLNHLTVPHYETTLHSEMVSDAKSTGHGQTYKITRDDPVGAARGAQRGHGTPSSAKCPTFWTKCHLNLEKMPPFAPECPRNLAKMCHIYDQSAPVLSTNGSECTIWRVNLTNFHAWEICLQTSDFLDQPLYHELVTEGKGIAVQLL